MMLPILKNSTLWLFICLLVACSVDTDVDDSAEFVSPKSFVIPVLGNFKDNADPFARGANMAAQEINDSGGIDGIQIELIYRNSACSAETARFEANSLNEQYPNLLAIAGPECSGAGAAINDILGRRNIPILAFTTSSPALSMADTFYRLQASDLAVIEGFSSAIMSETDKDNDGFITVGVISGDDPFTDGLGKGIVNKVTEKGGVVASHVIFSDEIQVDFGAFMEPLFRPNGEFVQYDVIVIMGFNLATANLTQQFEQYDAATAEIDLATTPVYVSGLKPEILNDGAFEIVKNVRSLTPDGAKSALVFPHLQGFLNQFNRVWGSQEVNEDAAQGYDAIMLLGLALLQAHEQGQVDASNGQIEDLRQGILDNLGDISRGMNDFEIEGDQPNTAYIKPFEFSKAKTAINQSLDINYNGAIGFIDFDELGDINYGGYFVQIPIWDGGKFVPTAISESCYGPIACNQ